MFEVRTLLNSNSSHLCWYVYIPAVQYELRNIPCVSMSVFLTTRTNTCAMYIVFFFQSYWSSVPQTLLAGATKQFLLSVFLSQSCTWVCLQTFSNLERKWLSRFQWSLVGWAVAVRCRKFPTYPPALPSNECKTSKVGTTWQTLRLLELHWEGVFHLYESLHVHITFVFMLQTFRITLKHRNCNAVTQQQIFWLVTNLWACLLLVGASRTFHDVCTSPPPLPSPLSCSRQHLSYDGCLEVRGEIIRTVLCCIVYRSCAQS